MILSELSARKNISTLPVSGSRARSVSRIFSLPSNDEIISAIVEWLRDQAIIILGRAELEDDIDLEKIEWGATVIEFAADAIEAREYEREIEPQ